MVTYEPAIVSLWICRVECVHRPRLRDLIVGLDTEWCASSEPNKDVHQVAILQLCVGHKCLIFQTIHSTCITISLFQFLANKKYTFVGVGVDEDVRKLTKDYGLSVPCIIDIGTLASKRLSNFLWGRMDLKKLSGKILRKELEKPEEITLSKWNDKVLTYRQIEYGCLEAFTSFELGRVLKASSMNKVF